MLLCGCMLAGLTACAGETAPDGSAENPSGTQVTDVPLEKPADDEKNRRYSSKSSLEHPCSAPAFCLAMLLSR